jgi:hypothetical protein
VIYNIKIKMRNIKNYKGFITSVNEGLWDRIFGSPTISDAAKDSVRGKGYSHVAKDDSQDLYVVFNGQNFYPSDIEYADVNDLGDIPRIENGKLIVANPVWGM